MPELDATAPQFASQKGTELWQARSVQPRVEHGRLEGRVVVVTGGSGCVGSGIVREWLADGATVIAPVRSEGKVPLLMSELEGVDTARLSVPIVDLKDEEAAAAWATDVQELHPDGLDHAVSCFGGWWQKGVATKQPLAELMGLINSHVATHFVFSKTVWPLLKKDAESSLIFITGGAGQRVLTPDSGLVSVAVAALHGLIMALRAEAEYEEIPIRINEMRIFSIIKRHGAPDNDSFPGHHAFSNRKVGVLSIHTALMATQYELISVDHHVLDETALTVSS